MKSIDDNFKHLQESLQQKDKLKNIGDDPIYYLIFPAEQMMEVKRRKKEWILKLEKDNWVVESFSLGKAIHEILQAYPLREVWLEVEEEAPLEFVPINSTLAAVLLHEDALLQVLKQKIASLVSKNGLLLVTDLEAIHPYARINAIEQKLQGNLHNPVVFLYPGERMGKTSLSFLGIYPEDGNYRSNHIGG